MCIQTHVYNTQYKRFGSEDMYKSEISINRWLITYIETKYISKQRLVNSSFGSVYNTNKNFDIMLKLPYY